MDRGRQSITYRKRIDTVGRFAVHPATAVALGVVGLALVLVAALWLRPTRKPDPALAEKPDAAITGSAQAPDSPAGPDASQESRPSSAASSSSAPAHGTELVAFYANWGEESYRSLERNLDDITVLMPMWYHLDSKGRVTVDNPEKQRRVMQLIERRNPDLRVMPIVNNYDKPTESWNAPAVAKMLRDPAKRRLIAKRIVTTLDDAGFEGVNIDFESFTDGDRELLVAFMAELAPLARERGLEVSMDVIVGSRAYDHERLARHADYLIPMMYDEHWKTSPPGAISSLDWYEPTLRRFLEQVPADKVVIGLGTYSYDWGKRGQRASSLSFSEAKRLARKKGKPIRFDAQELNSTFAYRAGAVRHEVWMLDAVSAFNHIKAASQLKPRGYAIWRLGAEDPSLWRILPHRDALDGDDAASLAVDGREVRYDESSGLIDWARTEKP